MSKHQRPLYAFVGDTFFTRSDSILGELIRWAERDEGEAPTWTNHTGVVVGEGFLVPHTDADPLATVVESLWHTHRHEWWKAHREEVMDGQRIRCFGPKEPRTDAERRAFLSSAMYFVGKRYGWWKLPLHLVGLGRFLRIDSRPICSYTAAVVNAAQNIGFGMKPREATPDPMLDFCESKRGKHVFVER